jgi:hypothetical protein
MALLSSCGAALSGQAGNAGHRLNTQESRRLGTLETLLGNLVTAMIAAGLTSWLSLRRSNQEKVWELRRAAYGLILSELAVVERICDNADEYIEQDDRRYFSESVSNEHNKEISGHLKSANDRHSADYLILSDEFISLYAKMRDEMSGNPYDSDPPEDHDRFTAAIRKYRPLLLAQGRSELTLNRGWRSILWARPN